MKTEEKKQNEIMIVGLINDLQLNVDMLKIIHDNPNLLAKYDTVIFNMFDLLRDLYLETGNQFNNEE